MPRLLPRVPSANDLPGDASSARLPDDLLDDQIKRFVVVAYVLLTGEPVFGGATTMQTLLDHVSAVPIPPSTRAPMPVPAWLDALVLACLEKDPARRPASATQLLARLALHDESRYWTNDSARTWWQTHAGTIAPAPSDGDAATQPSS